MHPRRVQSKFFLKQIITFQFILVPSKKEDQEEVILEEIHLVQKYRAVQSTFCVSFFLLFLLSIFSCFNEKFRRRKVIGKVVILFSYFFLVFRKLALFLL